MTKKRVFEIPDANPEVSKDKIARLKKAITEGTYQVRADQIASKILKEVLLELALNLNGREYRGPRNN